MEETINIKFDEEQLKDIIKKVTENIIKEAKEDSITKITDKEPKKHSRMYLEFKTSGYQSEVKKLYFGHVFNTLSREYASDFDFSCFGREKVAKLRSQGWKEEVFYK